MNERKMPDPICEVRSLPIGEHVVRVVHLIMRDSAHGMGSTVESADRQIEWAEENIPNVVLHLGGRRFAIDCGQGFQIGHISQAEPPKSDWYYRLTVFAPTRLDAARRAVGEVDVRYEEIGSSAPPGLDGVF
jgi:hypothetical protein